MPRSRISLGVLRAISSSPNRIRPARACTMPNTVRSRVDFPAPFAPMMQTISPARTASDTPRRTSTSSYPATTSRSSSSAPSAAKVRLDHARVAADHLRWALGDLLAVVEDDHAPGDVHDHVHVVLDQQHGLARAVQG